MNMQQIAAQVSEGCRPAEIARNLRIPLSEVTNQLAVAILLGHIRRTDVLLTFPEEWRTIMEPLEADAEPMSTAALHCLLESDGSNIDGAEVDILWHLHRSKCLYGDMYELLSDLERTLHQRVRSCLEEKYSQSERAWWWKVPLPVRLACVAAREKAEDHDEDPYSYTTLLDLWEIIKKRWELFEKRLPAQFGKKKSKLERDFNLINAIRNKIAHPVRGQLPSPQDYERVRSFHRKLIVTRWN
jgi:hypothetical protein